MADIAQVTYCGLYCGLCSQNNRIPRRAAALRDSMQKEAWEQWGKEIPGFAGFWDFLGRLAAPDDRPGCRAGTCGAPFCGIRRCARKNGIDVCPFCSQYPCHRIEAVAKGYVTMIADGKRMAEIGLERWIQEQEARKATGFCYVDIRCHPYEVPSE
jgi:hypothetical protein